MLNIAIPSGGINPIFHHTTNRARCRLHDRIVQQTCAGRGFDSRLVHQS
jgi:hypothetical protein